MAHLVLAAGEVLGGDEGLKDLEAWHRNSSHHRRARVGLSLAEQTDNWRQGEREGCNDLCSNTSMGTPVCTY